MEIKNYTDKVISDVFVSFGYTDFEDGTQLNEELSQLDLVAIVMEIEKRLDIYLLDSEVDKCDTVLKLKTLTRTTYHETI